MKLVSVYREQKAAELLYCLLKERDPYINISHCKMPSWRAHLNFIARKPYAAWYLIQVEDVKVGAIYLSKTNEIGVFILKRFQRQGYGKQAIKMLIKKHGRKRYLANINPLNERSIKMFENLGFRLLQETYELRP